jgi:hypothetical protein
MNDLQSVNSIQQCARELIGSVILQISTKSPQAAQALTNAISERRLALRLVFDYPVTHLTVAGLDPSKGDDQEPLVLGELHIGASELVN